MASIVFLFFLSFVLSWGGVLMAQKYFARFGILDNPKKYGKKRDPIPYSVGVIFFLVFFLVTYIYMDPSPKLFLIWVFGGAITLLSFLDDMFHVSPGLRLFVQIMIGAIIGITSIKIGYISNIFGGVIDLETYFIEIWSLKIYVIPLFFTIAWYVFIFNALNWTDGISGNTSGLSLINFGILFFLGMILFGLDDYPGGVANAFFIMQLSAILIALLIPFWYYDVREKILMGDSGTMFLGFMLATLAIIAGGKIATVLVVFGIYSVDAVYVIARRLLQKKNPLRGDQSHLHHRLLDLGLAKQHILILVYSLSTIFGIGALFLDKFGKIFVFLCIAFLVLFLDNIIQGYQKIHSRSRS